MQSSTWPPSQALRSSHSATATPVSWATTTRCSSSSSRPQTHRRACMAHADHRLLRREARVAGRRHAERPRRPPRRRDAASRRVPSRVRGRAERLGCTPTSMVLLDTAARRTTGTLRRHRSHGHPRTSRCRLSRQVQSSTLIPTRAARSSCSARLTAPKLRSTRVSRPELSTSSFWVVEAAAMQPRFAPLSSATIADRREGQTRRNMPAPRLRSDQGDAALGRARRRDPQRRKLRHRR